MIASMLGEVVGSYKVTGKISEGGMGAVYRGQHVLIGRPAAIKVLLPGLSMNHDIVNRFFNEARATSQIRHPGIVEVFDFGYLPSGQAFLVMEFLDGEPLSRRMKQRGVFAEAEAAAILRGVVSALAAAHAKGIVHRDLKPDNIFLVPDPEFGERPKILDFGIAKLADSGGAAKTRTGAVMGTPTYMSPEQCRGTGEVDHRADLYSIGCILYEMLTARPPFVSEGAGDLIGMHLFVEPDPVRRHNSSLSTQAESLTMQLLSKRPELRVQSAAELAQVFVQMAGGIGASLPGIARTTYPPMPTPAPPMPTPASPGEPTTLSGASGSASGIRLPRRARWPIAAVALLATAGGVTALVASGRAPENRSAAQGSAPSVSAPQISTPPVSTPGPASSAPPPKPTEVTPRSASAAPPVPAGEPAKPPVIEPAAPPQPAVETHTHAPATAPGNGSASEPSAVPAKEPVATTAAPTTKPPRTKPPQRAPRAEKANGKGSGSATTSTPIENDL